MCVRPKSESGVALPSVRRVCSWLVTVCMREIDKRGVQRGFLYIYFVDNIEKFSYSYLYVSLITMACFHVCA